MSNVTDNQRRLFIVDPAKPLAPAGTLVSGLLPGQMGIFNADNGVVPAAGDRPENIYFSLGLGSGTILEDVITTPAVRVLTIKNLLVHCYTPAKPRIWQVYGFNPKCESEYSIKFAVSSDAIMTRQGYRPEYIQFPVVTSCCEDCACGAGSCADLAIKLAKSIVENAKVDGKAYVKVGLFDSALGGTLQTTLIDPNDTAAIDAAIAATPDICFGLQIEVVTETFGKKCGMLYQGATRRHVQSPKSYRLEVVPGINLGQCDANFVVVQDEVVEGLSGFEADYQQFWQQAYIATGMAHYRVTEGGIPIGGDGAYAPTYSNKFSVLAITAKNSYHVGWNDRDHYFTTEIAFPCPIADHAANLTALKAALDALGVEPDTSPITDLAACATCV
jgi:hypothetical protein